MMAGEVALPAKNLALEPILSLKGWVFSLAYLHMQRQGEFSPRNAFKETPQYEFPVIPGG
jgi:hypothetical protein